jgi:hypothetical protein
MKLFSKLKLFALFIIAVAVIGGGYAATRHAPVSVEYKTPEEKDEYVRFVMEGYDTIRKNYWASTTEADFTPHFQLSLQKAQNALTAPMLPTKDRDGVAKMLSAAFETATSSEAKKNLALGTLNVALYNLQPIGRSGILSQTQETEFRQDVANVDPQKDLYADLGLQKGASSEDIKLAYETKAKILQASSSPEAKEELAKIAHAKEVLANPNTKDLYDVAKIEPTASNNIKGKTLYVKIDRISPTTLIEFGRTVYSATTTLGLNSMIIDLRGNLGGALDFAQAFLGLFLGANQYAFDLFHQNEMNVQRTTQPYFPELARYKDIVLLTDGMTQSTAEVTSAAFKKFKLGTVVGKTTRGWGTVENTFPLNTMIDPKEKYLLLLVHSITLRDDGEPIEGRGVTPNIDITSPDWKTALSKRFDADFTKVISGYISK